jgi:hypothetical protein
MHFKFVIQGPWSEKHNTLHQHMHKKEFWILTIKCGNNIKDENEAKGGPLASFSCLSLFPHLILTILFYACVEERCSAPLTIAHEKQT